MPRKKSAATKKREAEAAAKKIVDDVALSDDVVVTNTDEAEVEAAAKKVADEAEAKKVAAAKRPRKPKGKEYRATKRNMWHPFAKKRIPKSHPGVILEMDNFLETQIKAGLVREV